MARSFTPAKLVFSNSWPSRTTTLMSSNNRSRSTSDPGPSPVFLRMAEHLLGRHKGKWGVYPERTSDRLTVNGAIADDCIGIIFANVSSPQQKTGLPIFDGNSLAGLCAPANVVDTLTPL